MWRTLLLRQIQGVQNSARRLKVKSEYFSLPHLKISSALGTWVDGKGDSIWHCWPLANFHTSEGLGRTVWSVGLTESGSLLWWKCPKWVVRSVSCGLYKKKKKVTRLASVINLDSLDFKDHFKCSQFKDLLRIRFLYTANTWPLVSAAVVYLSGSNLYWLQKNSGACMIGAEGEQQTFARVIFSTENLFNVLFKAIVKILRKKTC